MRHLALLTALAAAAPLASADTTEFPAGYLYAASPGGIVEVAPDGTQVRTIDLGSEVGDVAFSARGTLYASLMDLDQVVEIDCQGNVLDTLSHASLWQPFGLAVGTYGQVYVTGWVTSDVYVFDRGGNFVRSFGDSSISGGAGIEVGPDGNVLVCSSSSEQIKEFDADGTFLRNVTNTSITSPRDLTTTPWGTTIVGAWLGDVEQVDEDGTLLNSTTGHNAPQAVAFGPDGLLYAANISYIQMFDVDVTGFTDAGEFASLTIEPGSITGLAFAPQRFTALVKGTIETPTSTIKIKETATLSIGPGGFHTMLALDQTGQLDSLIGDVIASGPDVPNAKSSKKRRIHAAMVPPDAAGQGVVTLTLDVKGAPDAWSRFETKGIKGTLEASPGGRSIQARIVVRGKKAQLN